MFSSAPSWFYNEDLSSSHQTQGSRIDIKEALRGNPAYFIASGKQKTLKPIVLSSYLLKQFCKTHNIPHIINNLSVFLYDHKNHIKGLIPETLFCFELLKSGFHLSDDALKDCLKILKQESDLMIEAFKTKEIKHAALNDFDFNNQKDLDLFNKIANLDLSHIESLTITKCKGLTELPNLPPGLTKLDLRGCEDLTELPDLSNLTQLKTLTFECQPLKKLPNLSNLTQLKTLTFDYCRALTKLPNLPPGLTKLDLRGCEALTELPDPSNLTQLKNTLFIRFSSSNKPS